MSNGAHYDLLKMVVVERYGFDINQEIVHNGSGMTMGQYLRSVSERDRSYIILRHLDALQGKEVVEVFIDKAVSGIIKRVQAGESGYESICLTKVK